MEMRGMMGGFYRISEWVMRLAVGSLLWILCSSPVMYLILISFMTKTMGELTAVLMLALFISPFLLFPATTALFSLARKWVMGEEDAPLFKTFFRSYKENYKQSMIGAWIYVLIGAVMVINFRFYRDQTGIVQLLSVVFVPFFFVVLTSLFYFFSFVAHVHMKLSAIVKNSIVITLANPFSSIFMLVVNVSIVYISTRFTFLIPFFMGSLLAINTFWTFNRIFTKAVKKVEAAQENAADTNALTVKDLSIVEPETEDKIFNDDSGETYLEDSDDIFKKLAAKRDDRDKE